MTFLTLKLPDENINRIHVENYKMPTAHNGKKKKRERDINWRQNYSSNSSNLGAWKKIRRSNGWNKSCPNNLHRKFKLRP